MAMLSKVDMRKSKKLTRKKRPRWMLHLYVSDRSPRSILAQGNLRDFCERYIKEDYCVTIIDIQKEPANARKHNILATPTLVWVQPQGTTTMVSTLGDTSKVLQRLRIVGQSDTFASKLEPGFSPPGHA